MLQRLFKYNITKNLTPFTNNYYFSSRSPAQVLQERGLLNQTSSDALQDPDFVNKTKEKYGIEYISTYTGYDPTADSLHLGNLLTIISVLRLKEVGIKPIFLVGGATGFIGDPSGKSKDRELLGNGELENNTSGIENTLNKTARNILLYLKENKEKLGLNYDVDLNYEVVNNLEFYKQMSALEFVRDLGKHFRLGVLLSKDSVSSRLQSQEGMSFMEFSYQLFQANDYLNLFKNKNCVLQIGGSDQWGNITSGCDLIHKVLGKGAYALTLPLLLTSAGKKFGKSEGNAIWIDSKKTNPRDLFQFLYNTPDSDVIDLLKKFTFFSIEKINEIEKEHLQLPEKRVAQKLLAQTLVEMLNYEESKEKPVSSLQIFFETNFEQIRSYHTEQLRAHFKGVESVKLSREGIQKDNLKLLDLAAQLKVKASKSEVRKLASAGGFSVNGKKISLDELLKFDLLEKENWMGDTFMVLQSGKKDFYLIELN